MSWSSCESEKKKKEREKPEKNVYNIADLILGVRVSLSTSSNSLLFMRLLNFFFFFSLKEVLLYP